MEHLHKSSHSTISRWGYQHVGNANTKICVTPNANPQHVGHVDFMLFVSLSLALGSQRKHMQFPVEYGF